MTESHQDPVPAIISAAREFVGRSREMAQLEAALSGAEAGEGRFITLSGEPGIGKTRIAQELARRARERGVQVLWGWCYEGEGAPSYWPWVDSLRTYVQRTEPSVLGSQLGTGAAAISELIPEVLEKLDGVEPAPAMEPDQARFRLFDSITGFLKKASEDSPLLLVLDDLHWADRPTLLLLEFVARQLEDSRILVVGTYRDTEAAPGSPLGESLGRLSRLPSFQRQPISGLPPEDVGNFVQGETGITAPPALLDAIHTHTEGNPFFLGEVARYLAELGQLGESLADRTAPHLLGIPQGIRDVIGQRLMRLSEPCNQALTTASVIGREFEFNLLGSLLEPATSEELLDLMDEAISAKIIEDVPGGAVRYQFRHALMQRALNENISTGRKVRLHARIGEALEMLYGDRPENRAAELAHHFAEAAPVLGTAKLVRYALMAGERALAAYAHEEAMAHFARGLKTKGIAVDDDAPAPDGETAALFFGIGRAQAAIRRRGAAHNLTRAFDYYAGVGDTAKAVVVAEFPMAPGVGRRRVTDLISKGLELAPPGSLTAAGLLSRYGWALGQEVGDYDNAMTALNQAITIAQDKGDRILEMSARANAAEINYFNLRFEDVLDDIANMRELGRLVDNPQAEVSYRYFAILAASSLGRKEEVDRLLDTSIASAEGIRNQSLLAGTLFANSANAYLHGQWALFQDLTDRGLAAKPGYVPLLMSRAYFEYEAGEPTQGREYLDQLMETARNSPQGPSLEFGIIAQGVPLIAEITGSLEHLEAAALASNMVLSYPNAAPFLTQLARTGLVVNKLLTGSLSGIEDHYEALKPFQSLSLAWLRVDRVLGQICRATGRLDQSIQHFEAAMDFCRNNDYRSEFPRLGLLYSGTLLDRGRDGDRELASAMLDEALAIADGLVMGPVKQQLARLQNEIPASRQTAASYPGGLTQREADVIQLIAQGKTDREIAEELFISVLTASTHVRNILNKTGAANRAEAASFATRHGID